MTSRITAEMASQHDMLTNERIHEIAGPADYYDRVVFARSIEAEVLKEQSAKLSELERQLAETKKDAERFRFANDSEEDFAICYWHEDEDGGDWWCDGPKGDAIALLDRAIADAAMKGE